MSFGVLTVLVLAGLAGPLLGAGRRVLVPAVVGELVAGLALGRSGARVLHPDQPTTAFLSQIGFAMLMFAAGMHVPLARAGLLRRVRRGGTATLLATLVAVPAGFAAARLAHVGHPGVYVVVLASGSAAVLMPCLEEFGLLADDAALVVAAQVALADVASIAAVPIVLAPSRAGDAVLGIVAVSACALALVGLVRLLRSRAWVRQLRIESRKREWALDLRLTLVVLFALCWLTVRAGASVLIAGFAVGLVVATIGDPKRLSRQVTGIGAGFFVPLYFVTLGARVDLRAFSAHVGLVELAAALVVANVVVHALSAVLTRQPFAAGLAATAQLGVPAAVVTIGLQTRLLTPGAAAAVMVAALASIALSTAGVALLARGGATAAAARGAHARTARG